MNEMMETVATRGAGFGDSSRLAEIPGAVRG